MLNPLLQLQMKASSIDRNGCYTENHIPQGTLLFHYEGELISAEEAMKREEDDTRPGIYTFWLNDDWAIDGLEKGNISKYLNHSCNANCEYEVGEHTIAFYASRDIFPGEELTIDYDYDFDAELTPCACGASECRGFINNLEETTTSL